MQKTSLHAQDLSVSIGLTDRVMKTMRVTPCIPVTPHGKHLLTPPKLIHPDK